MPAPSTTIQTCASKGHLHEKPVPGDNIVVISQAPKNGNDIIQELRESSGAGLAGWQGWHVAWYTLPKTNMALKNGGFQ